MSRDSVVLIDADDGVYLYTTHGTFVSLKAVQDGGCSSQRIERFSRSDAAFVANAYPLGRVLSAKTLGL